jgi:hypothetical protein
MKKQIGLSLLMTVILTSCISSPETASTALNKSNSGGSLNPVDGGVKGDKGDAKDDSNGGGLNPAANYKFSYNSRLISSHSEEFLNSHPWKPVALPGSLSEASTPIKFKIKLFKLKNEKQFHNVCETFGITRNGSQECECDIVDTNDGQFLKVEKEDGEGRFSVHVVPSRSARNAECEPDGEGDAPISEPNPEPTILSELAKPSVTVRCGDIEKELRIGANVHIDY